MCAAVQAYRPKPGPAGPSWMHAGQACVIIVTSWTLSAACAGDWQSNSHVYLKGCCNVLRRGYRRPMPCCWTHHWAHGIPPCASAHRCAPDARKHANCVALGCNCARGPRSGPTAAACAMACGIWSDRLYQRQQSQPLQREQGLKLLIAPMLLPTRRSTTTNKEQRANPPGLLEVEAHQVRNA